MSQKGPKATRHARGQVLTAGRGVVRGAVRLWIALATLAAPALASAQIDPAADPALEPGGYVALSADDEAQASLGGFRLYLERIRPTDEQLYLQLDPELDGLEGRELASDVVFWSTAILGLGAMIAAIPIATEVRPDGTSISVGMVIGGGLTFALGLLINAFIRPSRGDLMAIIDHHDELVGRR